MTQSWGADGPHVVCLHCTLGAARAWRRVAKHLDARVIAPDLVGHGAGPDWDASRDLHDHTTEHARTALPEAPFVLVGHSFGATVALRLAIEDPERVASLVLIEPVLFAAATGPGRRASDGAMAELGPLLAAGQRARMLEQFLELWGTEDGVPEDAVRRGYMEDRVHLIQASNPALMDDAAALLPRLDRVRVPVCLIEGMKSPPVMAEIMDRLEGDLGCTQRVRLKGAGHMAPVTHSTEVAEAIRAFLDKP